jgi:hypothetical protein
VNVDTRTTGFLLAGGAVACLMGTLALRWVSVNFLFTTLGANAWGAGGIGVLATLLAVALTAGAVIVLTGESAPVQAPPVALMAVSGLLALLAVVPILQGQAGAGAFVTLVGAGAATFAANGLRGTSAPRRAPVSRPRTPLAPSASLFCPSCGVKQEGGTAFCAQCGARLR